MISPSQAASRQKSVALCVTVLEEAQSVDVLLASVAMQSRPADEIVIVDGGSSDGTFERLEAWSAADLPLTILRRPGANISEGRNTAITASHSEIVAVTDAGVRLDPDWLSELTRPFHSPQPPDVVSGFFRAEPRSTFELALGATTLPDLSDLEPERFLPSSRSMAFTRAAWRHVGGYPEWLDYCEDLVFDLALRDAGFRFALAPRAIAHFRPRPSPRAFWTQYYRYARGDGKADLWRRRHTIRYATYLSLPLLIALATRNRWLLVPLLGAAAAYVYRPYLRLAPRLATLPLAERIAALAWVPLIRLIGDFAKMAGYPEGVMWCLSRNNTRVSSHVP